MGSVLGMASATANAATAAEFPTAPAVGAPTFDEVYAEHFDFVWRSVLRLGVQDAHAEDLAQEVFLVVHRKIGGYEGRSSLKTWLFGIVIGLVRNHRRTMRRKPTVQACAETSDAERMDRPSEPGPFASAAKNEAVRTLYELLDELEDDRRDVFVLAELEQLTAPEIAEALEVNLNTVYSRLRGARRDFDLAVTRRKASDEWRFG